jgi:hypothetical protein
VGEKIGIECGSVAMRGMSVVTARQGQAMQPVKSRIACPAW